MNDVEIIGSQFNEDNFHIQNSQSPTPNAISNARQQISNSAPTTTNRNSISENCYVGARVMRNSNDWKWGKQVKRFLNIGYILIAYVILFRMAVKDI